MSDTSSRRPRLIEAPPAPHSTLLAAGPELELRLTVAAADLPRVAALPIVTARAEGRTERMRLHTTYYDTPDLALARRGVAVRLRRAGGRTIQGVKTFGRMEGTAAVAVRQEWEWATAGDLDLAAMSAPELEHFVPPEVRPRLAPVIVTDVKRTLVRLGVDSRGIVELALDHGRITAMPASGAPVHRPVSEIELELKAGRLVDLFALAGEIHRRVPLRLAVRSKAHDGFALLTGQGPAHVAARPIGLSPATTVAEAFRHVGRNALAQLLENEPALASADGGDALREMAAAARRLDAAFGLLKGTATCPRGEGLRHELRRFGEVLAEARSWERIVETVESRCAGGGPPPAPLAATLSGRRRTVRQGVADLIGSPRWTAWVLDFAAWLEGGDWARAPGLDGPMADRAAPLLSTRFSKVAKTVGKLKKRAGRRGLDRLRRRLDKVRYTVDFLRSLLPADRVRPAHAALTSFRIALRTTGELEAASSLVAAARAEAAGAAGRALKAIGRRLERAARDAREEQRAGWAALETVWPWRNG